MEHYVVPNNVSTSISLQLEEEKARQYCGLDINVYSQLVGSRRWTHLSPYQYSSITCKADVIAYYRVMTQLNNTVEYLSTKKAKNNG